MSDIFISYACKDRQRVQRLAEALEAREWSVWWDRTISAGKTFDDVIEEEFRSAKCVIVVWSSASVTSSWVTEEASEGQRKGILVPVLFEDVEPPIGFGCRSFSVC